MRTRYAKLVSMVDLILGHYWGIDEVGVFVVPALLALWVLRWAEKRARRKAEESEDEERVDVDASGGGGST